MRHERAPSDCCNLTLGFRGREKFSTTILDSVGVPWRLSTGDSRFDTGDRRASWSWCRETRRGFRGSVCEVSDSGDSGMNGLDDSPGNALRGVGASGCLGVGVDSARVLGAGREYETVGVGLGECLAGREP